MTKYADTLAFQQISKQIEGGDNRLLDLDIRQLLGEFPHLVEAFNLDDSRHLKNFGSFWCRFKAGQKQKMSRQQPPPSPFFAAPGMNGAPMYGAPPSPAHYPMQPYAQSFQPQYGQIQPQYGQMVHQQPQLQRQFSQSQDPALELQWETLTTEKAYVDCYKHGSMVRKLWSTEEGPAALKTRIVNSGKSMALEGEEVTEMLQSCSSMRQSVLVLKRLGSSKVAEKRQQMEAIRRELAEEERKFELVKKVDVSIPVAENHLYDAQRVMGQIRVSGNLRQPAANRSTASPFHQFAGINHAENIDYAPEDTSSFSAPHPAVATGFQYVPAAAAPGFHQNAPPAASAARASAKRNLFGIPEHQEAAEQVETVESSGVKQGIFSNAPKPDMAASSGGFTTSNTGNHVNGPETVNSPPAASAPPKGLFSGAPKPTPNQGGFAFPRSGDFNSNTSGGDSDFTVPPPIQSTATGQYLFGGFNTSPLKGGFNFGPDKDDEKKEAAYKPNKRTRLG